MQPPTLKYLFFDAKNSITKQSFKIYKYKYAANLSIKAYEGQLGYTPKLFAGDDRDQIIVKVKRELFFEIKDADLLERLYKINRLNLKLLFTYKEENGKMYLIDFISVNDLAEIISDINIELFPKKSAKLDESDWDMEFLKAENIDWNNIG